MPALAMGNAASNVLRKRGRPGACFLGWGGRRQLHLRCANHDVPVPVLGVWLEIYCANRARCSSSGAFLGRDIREASFRAVSSNTGNQGGGMPGPRPYGNPGWNRPWPMPVTVVGAHAWPFIPLVSTELTRPVCSQFH